MNRSSARRLGFTLIELLVVIVIIALLAALLSVAVAGAISNAKRTRIKMELDNIAGEMEMYKADYYSYPPNHLFNNSTDMLKSHVRSLFPRALPADIETIPTNMSPAEVLWFCIRGYTTDPQRPVDFFNPNAKRTGRFTFEQGRLVETRKFNHVQSTMTPLQPTSQRFSPQPVYAYVPEEGKGAPYVYFDCSRPYSVQSRFYSGLGAGTVRPYRTTGQGNTLPLANAGKFQIVSAGLDGDYGAEVATPRDEATHKRYPNGENYDEGDKDNLVNFTDKSLENARP